MQVMRDHPHPRRRPHLGIWCRSVRHRCAIRAQQRPPPRTRRGAPQRPQAPAGAAEPDDASAARLTVAIDPAKLDAELVRKLARTNVTVSTTATTEFSVR